MLSPILLIHMNGNREQSVILISYLKQLYETAKTMSEMSKFHGRPPGFFRLMHDEPLYPSGTPVPHFDGAVFHDDRDPAGAVGEGKHLLKPGCVFLHIHILRVPVGRPGLIGVGSTRLSVDNDPVRHESPPCERFS